MNDPIPDKALQAGKTLFELHLMLAIHVQFFLIQNELNIEQILDSMRDNLDFVTNKVDKAVAHAYFAEAKRFDEGNLEHPVFESFPADEITENAFQIAGFGISRMIPPELNPLAALMSDVEKQHLKDSMQWSIDSIRRRGEGKEEVPPDNAN